MTKFFSYTFCFVFLLNCYFISLVVGASEGDTAPRQVHISLTGNPGEMAASWFTFASTQPYNQTVLCGTSPGNYNLKASASEYSYSWDHVQYEGYMHFAVLTGLQPNTKYYYVVGSDASGWSREFSFTTAQSRPEQYTIAVYGDMGILHSLPTVQQLENITHSHPLDFILHIGDISYADNRLKYGLKAYQEVWDQFFDEIENLTATIPYMVCPGNHEDPFNFTFYKARFNMPGSNRGLWYSFDHGGNTHFVMMSSQHPFEPGTQQYQWIENDLRIASKKNYKWIIMAAHYPQYCSNHFYCHSSTATRLRESIEPLLKKYKVDIFFAGHVHAYESTFPVYKEQVISHHYHNVSAPVHLTSGGAGCIEKPEGCCGKWYSPVPKWTKVRKTCYGFGLLTVSNSALHWQFLERGSSTPLDVITITK